MGGNASQNQPPDWLAAGAIQVVVRGTNRSRFCGLSLKARPDAFACRAARACQLLLPRQIISLTKPFRELIGQIPPLLRFANSTGGRCDRQHGPPVRGAVDRNAEAALGAFWVLRKIGFNHRSKFGGGL